MELSMQLTEGLFNFYNPSESLRNHLPLHRGGFICILSYLYIIKKVSPPQQLVIPMKSLTISEICAIMCLSHKF